MGLKQVFNKTSFVQYGKKMKDVPREVVLSPILLLSCAMYATAAIPLSEFIDLLEINFNLTDSIQKHGIKGLHLLYLHWRVFRSSSASAPRPEHIPRATSSLSCISVTRWVLPFHFS